jgi:hypothetical protein
MWPLPLVGKLIAFNQITRFQINIAASFSSAINGQYSIYLYDGRCRRERRRRRVVQW